MALCPELCESVWRELCADLYTAVSLASCSSHGFCKYHPAGLVHLTLEDGQSIAIERAAVGTLVKTDTGIQAILGFLHADEDIVGSYLRFTTKSASMAISSGHHASINGTEIDPSFIKLGDLLHSRTASSR
eukprot:scaffold104089_cov64-Phaeocystis_antarctica.AAC.5